MYVLERATQYDMLCVHFSISVLFVFEIVHPLKRVWGRGQTRVPPVFAPRVRGMWTGARVPANLGVPVSHDARHHV